MDWGVTCVDAGRVSCDNRTSHITVCLGRPKLFQLSLLLLCLRTKNRCCFRNNKIDVLKTVIPYFHAELGLCSLHDIRFFIQMIIQCKFLIPIFSHTGLSRSCKHVWIFYFDSFSLFPQLLFEIMRVLSVLELYIPVTCQ